MEPVKKYFATLFSLHIRISNSSAPALKVIWVDIRRFIISVYTR